ncbi:hypothetical protein BpHYR1_008271 [Brachionus plicatilis]|uniref:Uncharacterized protein n=1 Tax=Brachionus plicatilis TaxID=10195 RepID=A0A3M7SSV4_BRAPC|nr:hypothetical protein BpHYR1_008271 [Brachionus plicatilis]
MARLKPSVVRRNNANEQILIRCKKAFKDHEKDCIVDNARIHFTRVYDFPNTNCIYSEIRWAEGNSSL